MCVDLYDYDTIKVYLVPLQDDGLNLPLEFSFLKLNNGEKKKKKKKRRRVAAIWRRLVSLFLFFLSLLYRSGSSLR